MRSPLHIQLTFQEEILWLHNVAGRENLENHTGVHCLSPEGMGTLPLALYGPELVTYPGPTTRSPFKQG